MLCLVPLTLLLTRWVGALRVKENRCVSYKENRPSFQKEKAMSGICASGSFPQQNHQAPHVGAARGNQRPL